MNSNATQAIETTQAAPTIREQLEAIMRGPIRSRMGATARNIGGSTRETVKHCGSTYDVTPPSFHFVDGQKSARANPHMSRITRGKDGLSTDVRGWLKKIPNLGGDTFRFTPATAADIGANLNERRSRAMKMGIAGGLI